MKKKQSQPEILYFEDTDVFMKAVELTELRTYIQNKSIFKKNEHEVEIYDTQASFLINVGMNYAWLIKKEKE
jgi:hypothetical protein